MTQNEFINSLYATSLKVQAAVLAGEVPELQAELKLVGIRLEYPYLWRGRPGFLLEANLDDGTPMQMPFIL